MTTGMTITEMLGQSGLLTLLGMCIVFAFIIILIICMNLLKVAIHTCKLDKQEEKPQAKKAASPSPAVATQNPSPDIRAVVAAIATAIHEKESV